MVGFLCDKVPVAVKSLKISVSLLYPVAVFNNLLLYPVKDRLIAFIRQIIHFIDSPLIHLF